MFEHGDERYTALLDGKFPRGLGIQVYRRLLGVSQEELADKLGVTASCVSSWENGKTSCSPERLSKVSELLGVSVTRLQNPDKDDIEKASHTAVYQGGTVQRMVLQVTHEQGEEWPAPWKQPFYMFTDKELDDFFSHAPHTREWYRENKTPSKDRIQFGPDNLFSSRLDGSDVRLTRRITLADAKKCVNDERIYLGRVLRCLRLLERKKCAEMYDRISFICTRHGMKSPITSANHLSQIESGSSVAAYAIDCDFEFLELLEQEFGVGYGVLMTFTPYGRSLLRNGMSVPDEIKEAKIRAKKKSGQHIYTSDISALCAMIPQTIPVYIGDSNKTPMGRNFKGESVFVSREGVIHGLQFPALIPQVKYDGDIEMFRKSYRRQLDSYDMSKVLGLMDEFNTTVAARLSPYVRPDIILVIDASEYCETLILDVLVQWFAASGVEVREWVLP